MKLEAVVDVKCKIGEGPLWHPQEKRLYWVDIPDGILFRYDYVSLALILLIAVSRVTAAMMSPPRIMFM
jgi:sugar lactone lactonase YvrE